MLSLTPFQHYGGSSMAQWLVLWTPIVDHCIVFILTQCNLIAKRGQITEPMGRGGVEERFALTKCAL